MIKKVFKVAVFIFLIYGLYHYFSLPLAYVDVENKCNIKIEHSFGYKRSEVKKAIEFVRDNSPEDYVRICAYVKGINSGAECLNSSNGRVLGCAHLGDKIGFKPLSNSSTAELASTLIHEACHFHQGHTATPESYQEPYFSNFDRETPCYQRQNEFLARVGSSTVYP